jgi:UDP-N-acetylmuramate dehydrogenase
MSDIFTQLQENLGSGVKTAEPLAGYTNFKIGGPAKYFFVAQSTKELIKVIQVVDELKLPFIVLGGGTNVLVADAGFQGMVVIVKNNHLLISGTKVMAEAGVNLGYLVQKTIDQGLTGFEPLVAVPGTVGGAVYGNAGLPQTPRGFIGEWVKKVDVCRGDKLVRLSKEECNFGYRDSFFKHNNDIILSATFVLEKGNKEQSQELIKKYAEARKNQPYNMPSPGCIFTNFKITEAEEVKAKFKNEKNLDEFIARGQVPASWLIDKAGLKSKTIGGAQVSEKHANYIVNIGGAKAEDVVMLISFIKQQVRDKFGIQLQEEVRYIGF